MVFSRSYFSYWLAAFQREMENRICIEGWPRDTQVDVYPHTLSSEQRFKDCRSETSCPVLLEFTPTCDKHQAVFFQGRCQGPKHQAVHSNKTLHQAPRALIWSANIVINGTVFPMHKSWSTPWCIIESFFVCGVFCDNIRLVHLWILPWKHGG